VDDALFELPPPPGGEVVLFFGDFLYPPNDEGVTRFLTQIWPLVRRERSSACLRLVGRGSVERTAAARRPGDGVEALGPVPDIGAAIAESNVVVVPLWQGGGTRLKVVEAMAAGRPLASTSLGVAGTGFEAGEHGLVADDDDGLAGAVLELLDDPPAARRAGEAGSRAALKLRWQEVTRPLERLYRAWLDPPA
jgi:glycosyltransferase involved in cell wall biosynthesis